MHLHILGIAGTFMGGVAQLARALGHRVTGSDQQVYPPMSTQLEQADISFIEGFDKDQLDNDADVVVVGNVMSRGKPVVEHLLNSSIPYTSGPQWLYEHLLQQRWVIAISGTHGKTTTASMVAWILEYAGLNPGFLIGGVPENFGVSARLGESPFFVIEADEYDTAFFDKRSKFVHYHPRTLVINNLEFDHADIFADLAAIQTQFHHLVRMVPENGTIIHQANETAVVETLALGCWTPTITMHEENSDGDTTESDWLYKALKADFSSIEFFSSGESQGRLDWSMLGQHNAANALSAILAARHAGVPVKHCIAALASFKGIKRRMEVKGFVAGITVYDDFAHHPTAIATTLQGLRANVGKQRILAIFEPRSNTMQMGVHKDTLANAFDGADRLYLLQPEGLQFDLSKLAFPADTVICSTIDALLSAIIKEAKEGDHLLVMSNGGFGGIHDKIVANLG